MTCQTDKNYNVNVPFQSVLYFVKVNIRVIYLKISSKLSLRLFMFQMYFIAEKCGLYLYLPGGISPGRRRRLY